MVYSCFFFQIWHHAYFCHYTKIQFYITIYQTFFIILFILTTVLKIQFTKCLSTLFYNWLFKKTHHKQFFKKVHQSQTGLKRCFGVEKVGIWVRGPSNMWKGEWRANASATGVDGFTGGRCTASPVPTVEICMRLSSNRCRALLDYELVWHF